MANVYLQSQYGILNTNFLTAVRTGEIKSQYALTDDFATTPAENGMLLVVDDYAGEVRLPDAVTEAVWLVNTEIRDYENKGSKYFCINQDEFLPRLYKIAVGDVIETNCIFWNGDTYATTALVTAAIDASTVYAVASTIGKIEIVATAGGTEKQVFKVKEAVTLPNGEAGYKLVCTKSSY